ncbi:hypothetical protein AOXY_G16774 [Acipenser oxyrinchus oxyrinchus]|uniref:Ig-like domain-containing protein n=1 Tax=Acipenser oxyrinchus oxyrinchus TaxID=40147 RepID=A0AAD8D485_ACIOX|nr:hypothetical protein AOXY_G16774 [Acipenser oxyrinchus oxyrinchus]
MGNEMKSVMRVWLKMFILVFLQAASCENIYASEKSVVTLPCDRKPQAQVAWSYKKDASSAYTNIVKIVGRNTLFGTTPMKSKSRILPSTSLQIQDVETDFAGFYQCEISGIKKEYKLLVVSVVPEHPGLYLQSSSLKLDCLVSGSSDERPVWLQPGSEEVWSSISTLEIKELTMRHSGTWRCMVGSFKLEQKVEVLVESSGVNGVCCLHGNASGFRMEWSNAEGQARDLQMQQGESKTTLTLPMAQMNSTAWKCNLYLGSKLQTSIDYTPGTADDRSSSNVGWVAAVLKMELWVLISICVGGVILIALVGVVIGLLVRWRYLKRLAQTPRQYCQFQSKRTNNGPRRMNSYQEEDSNY